jgi:hypothetical protein
LRGRPKAGDIVPAVKVQGRSQPVASAGDKIADWRIGH